MDIKRIFENHSHWQAIVETVAKLTAKNFTVYLAGGCVRDAIMGRVPNDFDIATSARPDEVKQIFPQSLEIGRAFGVMILPMDGFQIEIATFRRDGEYLDGRRPTDVTFSEPEEDAKRRDFTVNGLFYDLQTFEIKDYVGGLQDIELKMIRAIGDPKERFSEDKLRMLRAARFSAQLGFEIEAETLSAIAKQASEIQVVSKERVTEEFKKLSIALYSERGLEVLKSTGLLQSIWPKLQLPQHELWDLFLRAQHRLSQLKLFSVFLAEIFLFEFLISEAKSSSASESKDQALKFQIDWEGTPFIISKELKREVDFLIQGFFAIRSKQDEVLLMLNEDAGPLLTEFCFVLANLHLLSELNITEIMDRFLAVSDQNGNLPKPFLTGEDLIKMGVRPSAKMGELLKQSYMAQIKGEITTKDQAQLQVLELLGS